MDFETTGLDAHADRIVEVGFVLTDWNVINGALRSYVNPETAFDNPVNGLNSAAVADAPTFSELTPFIYLLLLWADEYVAHNARFDLGFLREELARCGLTLPSRLVFDTMRATGGKSLQKACEHHGVYTEDARWHSALEDAVMCFRLLKVVRGEGKRVREGGDASLVPRFS